MSKPLTEQKVLKKLNIEDFRHLTKDKVITMATMLDKMDPEVAKKAIEQFPDFSKTMKEIFVDFKKSIDKAIDTDETRVDSFYSTCDAIISSCQQELEKNELSFDERKQIIDKMIFIATMKSEKDTEGKRYNFSLIALGATVFTITATTLLAALGGNFKLDTDSIKKLAK